MIPVARPELGEAEWRALREVVESGWVAQGPRVEAFERALAARCGAAHGVALSSCTAALHLALVVAGVGPGDEVVVPSLSFIATANAVRHAGATPVFADVDAGTQNLTAATIAPLLGARTRAVIVVHQAGMPADVAPVHALCDPLGVAVVEDAACAIGSVYRDAPVGGHSDLVAFSFHPRKVLTTGEGGMLLTSREDLAVRLRRLREHGMSVSASERHRSDRVVLEQYLEPGFNYRMTDLQAAMGVVQLDRLDGLVARRRALADAYRERLAALPGVRVPQDPPHGRTNHQSYWVVLPDDAPADRDDLLARLHARGVSCRRGIMAAHLEPAYAGTASAPLPVTEHLTRRSLILPLHHALTAAEQDQVVDALAAELHAAPAPRAAAHAAQA